MLSNDCFSKNIKSPAPTPGGGRYVTMAPSDDPDRPEALKIGVNLDDNKY